jgi:hypothetical protein
MYGIFCIIAEGSPGFGRSCVALATGHLSEKLGDMKLKKPAGDALMLFAEKTSLQFVLNQGTVTRFSMSHVFVDKMGKLMTHWASKKRLKF